MPTIANIELNSQTNILDNIIQIEHAIITAKQHFSAKNLPLDLVVLPENAFCFGKQGLASQYFDDLKNWCGKLANHYQIHLLAGTLPYPYRPDGTPVADNKFRQSSLLFEPDGNLLARYDKIHLFKATVNDKTANYDEGQTFEAGDTPVVAKTAMGNIGLMVCFDLRFPLLATRLRQLNADILTAPSAFTFTTGKAHWQTLLTARALDSQCLVVGSAQGGEHLINTSKGVNQRETWGHSHMINAFGESIGEPISHEFLPPNSQQDLTDLFKNLPLSHFASTFLPNASILNYLSDEKYPDTAKIVVANFDNDEQNRFRNQINLFASQRFDVKNP